MNEATATSTLLSALHQHVEERLGDMDALSIQRVVIGVFFTGVILNNGVGGMCATPIKSIPEAVCCPSSAKALPMAGKLLGKTVRHMLLDLHRPQDLRRALAVATLNALAETLWRRDGPPQACSVVSGDAFSHCHFAPTDKIVLVGAFPPYIRALRKAGQDFRILEKDPTTLKEDEMPYYAAAETAASVVPWADALVATGTTLMNDSLESLLSLLRAGAKFALIGPTVPLLPQAFAWRGVSMLGGTRVKEAQVLLDLLAEGASGYHFFEKSVERVTLRLEST